MKKNYATLLFEALEDLIHCKMQSCLQKILGLLKISFELDVVKQKHSFIVNTQCFLCLFQVSRRFLFVKIILLLQ